MKYGAHTKRLRKMTNAIHRVLVDAYHVYGPDGDQPLDWVANRWAENRWFAADEAKEDRPPKQTT